MGMTVIEKILARAGGVEKVSPGELAVVNVDMTVILDMSFLHNVRREFLKLNDPDKTAVIYDHMVPAPDRNAAEAHGYGRAFVKRFGISRFHDVGPNQGICHTIIAENGYARPGTVLVCADSHTCAAGAFNCAARGVGFPDMVYAATTGKAWFQVGETIRYDLVGKLRPGVATKDVFLHIAGLYGDHANQNVEFGGPGLANLSIDARRTLATMGAELSAEFVTFEPDQILIDYMSGRTELPFEPAYADPDARYLARHTIDLDAITPQVALPDAVVNNSVSVDDIADQKIDQAFIGSCANGSLDDLAEAARVVAGRQVATGVRFIVTPGSQQIYRRALAAGYVQTLLDAGAVVTPATCGACFGGHMGLLGPNETCITASTRNFKGRMGDPSARIFMASPATVAASAIAGHIVHPDYAEGARS
ncbi:homoaconitate hydratase family protein [Bosea caraganae]|uniref:Homoaconitate hydratase family protein n=1 Tax=Bosea caraganae TaxID=2763117 RepID=A0A370L045_9HYPH|nr:aconitase/3-isopropylmalate dehydratase large subunit family protein [Bosea caraganae]RDJ20630.1 homoaconitate hydratase family protein [Bosea caraganae]RDJ28907.1 homoaconitate hydratase family protein [Bosea caraganae]